MVAAGRADANRLIIRGGSAGGYTTLAALTFHDTFKSGASYYGISDLEVLQKAPTSSGALQRFADRSIRRRGDLPRALAVHFTDRLPIILSGASRTRWCRQIIGDDGGRREKKGIKVKCVAFGGEQHGFIRRKTSFAPSKKS